jgi:hypothetical protein
VTTTSQAFDALRARIGAASLPFRVIYQNEKFVLPDAPTTFVYVEFIVDRGSIVAFGGGRGNNVQRNPASLHAYVFVPQGMGLKAATDAGELIASQLGGYRDTDVSCFDATVRPGGDGMELVPPGMTSAVDGYYWARVDVELFFDQSR